MKFSEYLTEGAIEVNSSMKRYAEDVFNIISRMIKENVTFTYFSRYDTGILLNKEIETKYGKFQVKTILRTSGNSHADSENGKIYITVSKKEYDKISKNDRTFIDNFKSEILHELVHIVDPKLSNPKINKTSKDKIRTLQLKADKIKTEYDNEKDPKKKEELKKKLKDIFTEYYKFPWEVDAYMSGGAEERIKEIKNLTYTKKEAYNWIRNLIPETPSEEVYFSDENLKKRYIKLIHKLVDKKFDEIH